MERCILWYFTVCFEKSFGFRWKIDVVCDDARTQKHKHMEWHYLFTAFIPLHFLRLQESEPNKWKICHLHFNYVWLSFRPYLTHVHVHTPIDFDFGWYITSTCVRICIGSSGFKPHFNQNEEIFFRFHCHDYITNSWGKKIHALSDENQCGCATKVQK